jgi:rare lipoprotein A
LQKKVSLICLFQYFGYFCGIVVQKNMRKTIILLLFLGSVLSLLWAQDQGSATYYSPRLQGRHTTDGSRYHPDSLTCAHKTYPLGTYLLVRNPKNNEQVIVKVTDRGPFTKKLMIDLSYSAAQTLDIIRQGVATVEVSKLNFIPQALSFIPTPRVLLNIEQMYVVKSLMNKFLPDDKPEQKPEQKKK